MKNHRFHPAAEMEYTAAIREYAGIGAPLGRQFVRAIEQVIDEICVQPRVFREFDPPARRHFRHRFPYAVIYLDRPEEVWIVAVAHFKQRPGYWRNRLR